MKKLLCTATLLLGSVFAGFRTRTRESPGPQVLLASTPKPMTYLDVAVPSTWRDEPPGEFRIWAYGDVATSKGLFQFTPLSAQLCMGWQEEWGNRFSFDYNHAFWEATGEATKSAGDYVLELRDDGLWAADVQWTEAARTGLKNREWLYFSPALDSDENNVITRLWNMALTNVPATKNQKPMMAANVRDHRSPSLIASVSLDNLYRVLSEALDARYRSAWLVEIFNDYAVFEHASALWSTGYIVTGTSVTLGPDATEVTRQYIPVQGGQTMRTVLNALGLAATATEADALQVLNTRLASADNIQRQLLSATGQTDVQAALGVVAANAQAATQLSAAKTRITELEGEGRTTRLNALIAQGKADRKLTPALETWAASQTPEALEAYLQHAPVITQLSAASAQEPPATGGDLSKDAPAGAPVTFNGKTWAEMAPADKHNLYVDDKPTYDALRADHQKRGGQ